MHVFHFISFISYGVFDIFDLVGCLLRFHPLLISRCKQQNAHHIRTPKCNFGNFGPVFVSSNYCFEVVWQGTIHRLRNLCGHCTGTAPETFAALRTSIN